jgi:hypothetical protein
MTKTHGLYGTPLYFRWSAMVARCEDGKPWHKTYTEKGITVCAEWRNDPVAFCNWGKANGYKKGLYLDRIDNYKGYYPENCRWVDVTENNRNRTNTVLGKKKAAEIKLLIACGFRGSQISRVVGVSHSVVSHVLRNNVWKDVDMHQDWR